VSSTSADPLNGFTKSLRQEVTQRHVRVGVVEPGGVATELGSHDNPEVRNEMIDPFYERTEVLAPEDVADGVAYIVTRPRHTAIGSCGSCPPTRYEGIRERPTIRMDVGTVVAEPAASP
jgi:NADP-dependent 3-hydroxy acid dehydrogenase YdfG